MDLAGQLPGIPPHLCKEGSASLQVRQWSGTLVGLFVVLPAQVALPPPLHHRAEAVHHHHWRLVGQQEEHLAYRAERHEPRIFGITSGQEGLQQNMLARLVPRALCSPCRAAPSGEQGLSTYPQRSRPAPMPTARELTKHLPFTRSKKGRIKMLHHAWSVLCMAAFAPPPDNGLSKSSPQRLGPCIVASLSG